MTENKNAKDISSLAHNLDDALDITNMFIKMFQEEMMTNVGFRGKIEQSLSTIVEKIENLHSLVITGSNHSNSLMSRINRIEFTIQEMEKVYSKNQDKDNKVAERFWSFIIQNGISIVTWLAIGGWAVVQFMTKK